MLIVVIIILAIFFLWTAFNSLFMPKLPVNGRLSHVAKVSILVPLRNEERNAAPLVKSLRALTYPELEFVMLDDQSTDLTLSILGKEAGGDDRFRFLSGKELTEGWVGKVHACDQLQKEAHGEYLLFLDADVRLQPQAVENSLSLMQSRGAKLLTGFAAFEVPSFLSKLLVPMQQFVVFFHLPLALANRTMRPSTTAAHGGFMLFERNAYREMGGHEEVRSSLVEDVHIARKMKGSGHRVLLANITGQISCRMYERNGEVWEGFLKNIYNGIGRSAPMAFGLTLFYFFFYVLPLPWVLYGIFTGQPLYVVPYILIVLQRMIVDIITHQRWTLAFLMPLSALAFIAILNASMWTSWRKKSYQWKGRHYS
ncbi:glycosyltransferase [Rossellomorea aquimaris]|uniref:glycosyltransferase n=1 Tax=Rossellomorea aquimaris TaxID=189382 RepID=UPI001CD3E9E4|nr:glycosyltransferase family 2 protein [Rossellomorea aquimaris]MCA1054982.1 glycosyltransferase [Rossellomorea aquimaris]